MLLVQPPVGVGKRLAHAWVGADRPEKRVLLDLDRPPRRETLKTARLRQSGVLRAPWLAIAFASGPARPPSRERLLALVRRAPGITVSEARAQAQVGWGTFYHDLHVLKRERRIETLTAGHRSLLYPAGYDKSQGAGRALLRGATVRKVAAIIRDHPGCSVRDVIRLTDESPRVVYHHIRRLAELELVTSTSRTRHHDISATELLVELLAVTQPHASPSQPDSQGSVLSRRPPSRRA